MRLRQGIEWSRRGPHGWLPRQAHGSLCQKTYDDSGRGQRHDEVKDAEEFADQALACLRFLPLAAVAMCELDLHEFFQGRESMAFQISLAAPNKFQVY